MKQRMNVRGGGSGGYERTHWSMNTWMRVSWGCGAGPRGSAKVDCEEKFRDRTSDSARASGGKSSLSLCARVRSWIARASKDLAVTCRLGVDLLWCRRGLWSALALCFSFSLRNTAGVAGEVLVYRGDEEETEREEEDVSPSSLSALASSTPSGPPVAVSVWAPSSGAPLRADRVRFRRRFLRVELGTRSWEALSDVVELFPRSSRRAASFSRSAARYVKA